MDSSVQPRISVCIPVYNCEKYIGLTVESVLAQTLQDFELLILDNCSTDGTLQIIRRYDDSRIRVIENKTNIGMEGNWNKALSEAGGEYIKILCADDLLYPTCLQRQLAVYEDAANSGVALVCCGRDIINEHNNKLLRRNFKGHQGRMPGKQAITQTIRAGTNLIGEPTAVLIRADVLTKAGGFDADIPYLIDLDFWCRILLAGDLYIIPDSLCAFRVSYVSLSVTIGHSQSLEFRKFIASLGGSSTCQLNSIDRGLGMVYAFINSMLRQLFYKLLLQDSSVSGWILKYIAGSKKLYD